MQESATSVEEGCARWVPQTISVGDFFIDWLKIGFTHIGLVDGVNINQLISQDYRQGGV